MRKRDALPEVCWFSEATNGCNSRQTEGTDEECVNVLPKECPELKIANREMLTL